MIIPLSNWCFIVNIIISIGLPIGVLIYFLIRKRRCVKAYFIGMLVFVVSQIFLRIPLIQVVLPKMDWYLNMQITYPILLFAFLGITAGIFEEVGRFIGFKAGLKTNRTWLDGIAFGLGHGGIEAILLVAVSNIKSMIIVNAINNGTFEAAKFGISEETAMKLFGNLNNVDVLCGGVERISTIILHVFLTLVVLYGIRKGKKIYLGLAIILHGIVDFLVVTIKSFGATNIEIEVGLFIFAIVLLVLIIKSKGLFEDKENANEIL